MSTPIRDQANKLWHILADPETGDAYKKTATLTWQILRESGYLAWLIICLGLVAGEWLWKTGYGAGWAVRDWVNSLDEPNAESLLNETGKNLLAASKSSVATALNTARTQLGMEPLPAPAAIAPAPEAPPAPPAPPAAKSAAPAPAPTPQPEATPTVEPAATDDDE